MSSSLLLVVFIISLLALILFKVRAVAFRGADIQVERISSADSSASEEWRRVTTEEDVLGISASRFQDTPGEWQVSVNAAEFARDEPLETDLHDAVSRALQGAKGVTSVVHEDREVWIVYGNVRGDDLIRAVSPSLDRMRKALEQVLEGL